MRIFKIKDTIRKSEIDTQDGGQYKEYVCANGNELDGLYVRIGSWDETKTHNDFNFLMEGKKITITIKVE